MRFLNLGAYVSYIQFWSFCNSYAKEIAGIIQFNLILLSTTTKLIHLGANFLATKLQVRRRSEHLRRSVVAESTPRELVAVHV